jgi:hypothetical protein
MNILEALEDINVVLRCGPRWLIVDTQTKEFVVMQKRSYETEVTEKYRGRDEAQAVKKLMSGKYGGSG